MYAISLDPAVTVGNSSVAKVIEKEDWKEKSEVEYKQ